MKRILAAGLLIVGCRTSHSTISDSPRSWISANDWYTGLSAFYWCDASTMPPRCWKPVQCASDSRRSDCIVDVQADDEDDASSTPPPPKGTVRLKTKDEKAAERARTTEARAKYACRREGVYNVCEGRNANGILEVCKAPYDMPDEWECEAK